MSLKSKIILKQGDLDAAQSLCSKVLSIDINSIEASQILADISFKQNSFDFSFNRYKEMLLQTPQNFNLLIKMIKMAHRNGDINAVKEFIQFEDEYSEVNKIVDGGFYFCKGLFLQYNLSNTIGIKIVPKKQLNNLI